MRSCDYPQTTPLALGLALLTKMTRPVVRERASHARSGVRCRQGCHVRGQIWQRSGSDALFVVMVALTCLTDVTFDTESPLPSLDWDK